MPSRLNQLIVREAVEQLRGVEGMVAVAYEKVSATDADAIRRDMKAKKVRLRVVRNRLTRIALKELGRERFGDLLRGETAVVSSTDALEATKAAVALARERKLRVRGGWVAGMGDLSETQVRELASLPPKPVLMARLAGVVSAPATRLAGMLKAPVGALARAMSAWNEKREKAAPAETREGAPAEASEGAPAEAPQSSTGAPGGEAPDQAGGVSG